MGTAEPCSHLAEGFGSRGPGDVMLRGVEIGRVPGAKLLCFAGDEEAAPQTWRAPGRGKAAIVQGCPFKRCPCPWKHFQQQRWEQAERRGGRAGPRGFPIKARTCSPPWELRHPPVQAFFSSPMRASRGGCTASAFAGAAACADALTRGTCSRLHVAVCVAAIMRTRRPCAQPHGV